MLEVVDLAAQVTALVSVGYQHAVVGHLHNLTGGLDVGASADGIVHIQERFVLHQFKATAVVDQCVAGNTCGLVVGLREATIDDHQSAFSLDGILTLGSMNRHVAIDDVAVVASDAKGIEDVIYHLPVITQAEVVAFLLMPRFAVGEEVALIGSHLRLVEQWTLRTTPQIEEEIDGCTAFLTLCIGLECCTDGGFNVLHEFASTTHVHDVMQGAVFVEGNGSMEKQVVVADAIHGSMAEQQADVSL